MKSRRFVNEVWVDTGWGWVGALSTALRRRVIMEGSFSYRALFGPHVAHRLEWGREREVDRYIDGNG